MRKEICLTRGNVQELSFYASKQAGIQLPWVLNYCRVHRQVHQGEQVLLGGNNEQLTLEAYVHSCFVFPWLQLPGPLLFLKACFGGMQFTWLRCVNPRQCSGFNIWCSIKIDKLWLFMSEVDCRVRAIHFIALLCRNLAQTGCYPYSKAKVHGQRKILQYLHAYHNVHDQIAYKRFAFLFILDIIIIEN